MLHSSCSRTSPMARRPSSRRRIRPPARESHPTRTASKSVERFADLLIAAVLLAGLYATMAYGLGLIYGVLRIVNLNHGGIIMAGAYMGWVLHERLGIDPYLSIPIVMLASFFLGIVIYRGLVKHLARGAAGAVQSLLLLF